MPTFRDNNLILDEGETVRFPVEGGHPLAECQQMRRINSLEDVKDFQFVQEWAQGFEFGRAEAQRTGSTYFYTGSRLSGELLLRYVRERSGGVLMALQLADFIVPIGSTVLLNSPLVEVNANTVVIAGDLKFTDDLVIRCNEIRGA